MVQIIRICWSAGHPGCASSAISPDFTPAMFTAVPVYLLLAQTRACWVNNASIVMRRFMDPITPAAYG
jgi:hypothetical protein